LVNPTATIELERALQRYGADLYRLALLLSDTPTSAANSLLAAARQIAASGAAPSEPALIAALIAALPREAPGWLPRRAPAWAREPGQPADRTALLGRLARLPRPARLALGLALMRSYDPEQIGELLGRDAEAARAQIRDALLELAPAAGQAAAQLPGGEIPEECAPTRAALALNDPRLHTDSGIRGHLATCDACRAAERAWQQLTGEAESALRATLREVHLPNTLAQQLHSAAQPASPPDAGWLASSRMRVALVVLPVLALIALVVWPHGAAPSAPSGSATGASAAQAPAPLDLVRRAQAQLYQPPAGSGIWHSRYAIQWSFPDDSYALLNADEWLDQAGGRSRLQLVHHSGGGPYEYMLANGTQSVWYGVGESYASSLYPLKLNGAALRSQFALTPKQRSQMFAARLRSGAWAIAENYLLQATSAELHTWGRQRDGEGRLRNLISFSGVSPLALPADAPSATASRVTILLSIDEASGRLLEARELFGAAGAEQTARTTWQLLDEEWIDDPGKGNQIFDHESAWNGIGDFADRGAQVDPAMPLLDASALVSPLTLLKPERRDDWMPAAPPPGADHAALLDQLPNEIGADGDGHILTLVYSGAGRLAMIRSLATGRANLPPSRPEAIQRVAVGDLQAVIWPLPAQGYMALISRPSAATRAQMLTMVRTAGYTRAELLALLKTLGQPALAGVRQQAPLFADTQPHDEAWQALIGALADPPTPPAGGARHFVEQIFRRQAAEGDPLPDPYHRPPYGGWPERYVQDNWVRGGESSSATLGADGALYAQQYRGPAAAWDYDHVADRVITSKRAGGPLGLNEDQDTVLRMLQCGGARLETTTDGTRAVVLSERGWQSASCQNPSYPGLWAAQAGNTNLRPIEDAPFLADLPGDELTTVITLGANGRPVRTAVWAGPAGSGTLVQSWELTSEEVVPANKLPAETFSPVPHAAAIDLASQSVEGVQNRVVTQLEPSTLEAAARQARSPLLGFDSAPGAPQLLSIYVPGPPVPGALASYSAPGTGGVFGDALGSGYAIYSTYSISTTTERDVFSFYQGAAPELRAYLRTTTNWSGSAPTQVQIGERTIDGWQLREPQSGTDWLVFELDGTLVAVAGGSSPGALAALDQLQRVEAAAP
jgi:hypothetical protein